MILERGCVLSGPAGTATELIVTGVLPSPDWAATVRSWFLHCPGQSPAWSDFMLSIIHLRPIEDVPPAVVKVPGATHEVILFALDPELAPRPFDHESWRPLLPVNVTEQVELPDDDAASSLTHHAAMAIIRGDLPAEPALSGAVEPWRTSMIRTSAHLRGEEHAP